MPRVPVHFGPQTDEAKSIQGGGSQLVNCYVEKVSGGKMPFTINTDPGLLFFSLVTSGQASRGACVLGNNLYVIVGENIYKVASSGVTTGLGAILGAKACSISINRKSPYNQITIVADTVVYYLENDVLAQVTTPNLPAGVHSCAYLNGRTIYGINDGRFFISQINDTANVNALDFAEAERDSDPGIRVFANGEEFWYFGSRSLEIFRDTGAAFPFQPLLGAGQGKGAGCSCKNSVAIVTNAVVWVNDTNSVVMAHGYSPHRISDHDVERDIEAAVDAGIAEQVIGFSWGKGGHQFYHLSCPLWTWVYDASTGTWHKKESYLAVNWRGLYCIYAFNKWLVLGATDGTIYEYTYAAADENGQPLITRIISTPVAYPMTRLTRGLVFPTGLICSSLHVEIQAGVGRINQAPHVVDPMIILRVSSDGGMTFGNDFSVTMGQQGQWKQQVRFNRLGYARDAGMVFEIRSPEPVERCFITAVADVTPIK